MGWIYISNLNNLAGFNLQLNKHYNCIVHRQKANGTTQTLFVQLKVFLFIDKAVVWPGLRPGKTLYLDAVPIDLPAVLVTSVFFNLPNPRRISWSELSFSINQDEYPVLDRLSPENRTKVPELIVFLQKTKRTSPSLSSFSRKRKSWCRLSFSRKRSDNRGVGFSFNFSNTAI